MFNFLKTNLSGTESSSVLKYRSDLDGLRAMAVLAVVGFHAFPFWVKGGFVGVDIFFVISGFLISSIIFKDMEKGKFSFAQFYARRIKRIFPALVIILIATYVFGWFVLFADEYKLLGKHIVGGAGFIANFQFWNESGYFDTAAESKPLLHLWSLGIEEQFYIIWPFLIWLLWRFRINILLVILVVFSVSFILNLIEIKSHPVETFYSPQTRFWELLCGSTLAWLMVFKAGLLSRLLDRFKNPLHINKNYVSNTVSLVGFLLIILSAGKFTKELAYPGAWALIPTIGACFIIAVNPQAWFNRKILSNRILVWVGLISYPLYLWHWPLLSFARVIEGDFPSRSLRIAVIAASFVLAWLTYIYIEKPIRFGNASKLKIRAPVVAMVLIACMGLFTFLDDGIPARSIAKQLHDFDYTIGRLDGYKACDDPLLIADGVEFNFCLINSSRKPTAALIGDSHAEDKFSGLVKNDDKNDWALLANASCPPVIGIDVEGDVKNCRKKFENVLNYLAHQPDIKTVALSFFGNYFLTTTYAADHTKTNIGPNAVKISMEGVADKSRAEIYYIGLDKTLTFLEKNDKKIYLFIDVPELPFFPKDCFRNSLKKCDLNREEVLVRQGELRALTDKLKASHQSVVFYDPINFLCSNELCGYKKNGVVLYRDSHHLSLRGSDLFARDFLRFSNQN